MRRETEIVNPFWREEWAGNRLHRREELIDGEWVVTFPKEEAA